LRESQLLATKLYVLRARAGLVCAPAGLGKTTLLAEWLRHTGRPAAWLARGMWRRADAENAFPSEGPAMPPTRPPLAMHISDQIAACRVRLWLGQGDVGLARRQYQPQLPLLAVVPQLPLC
jgi:hypothetical protein